MQVTVELFGIPRARAGVSRTVAEGATLGEILLDLARRYPELAATCFDGQALKMGYVANVRGERFVTDPQAVIQEGDAILLLSQDAGG